MYEGEKKAKRRRKRLSKGLTMASCGMNDVVLLSVGACNLLCCGDGKIDSYTYVC